MKPQFDFNSLTAGEIKAELSHIEATTKQQGAEVGMFTVLPANDWIEQAKKRPVPKMLFSELWFEGELCILFADTNLGKSILAVQIADSISKGEAIPGFKLEAQRQKVLYFDFELSDKQFENRYSIDFGQHHVFNDWFFRVEINPEADLPEGESTESYINYSLEQSIIKTEAKILIIDNLTYLRNETERAKDALPLMKHLKALKSKYNLSVLALAHTPKRDLSKPINRNDLQGSKMLMNFVDSSFAIGESTTDKSLRYIKQIKVRFTENLFDTENVCVCQIVKPFNFLHFEFLRYSTEAEHLKEISVHDKERLEADILELHQSGKGLSLRDIATQLNTNQMKVKRVIDKSKK